MKAREVAFASVMEESKFCIEFLQDWHQKQKPSPEEFRLAQNIAYGSIQLQKALDHQAKFLCDRLPSKKKEKILLRQAIYQYYFLQKIPLHAIVNESIEIAKKYCHKTFAAFLNPVLRKMSATPFKQSKDLDIKYSVPKLFVDLLIHEYGVEQTEKILYFCNQPAIQMARLRSNHLPNECTLLSTEPIKMITGDLMSLVNSPDIYIQNRTPATLFATLAREAPIPKIALDLCAAPGGKLLLAHDFFPTALLHGNDSSADRMQKLKQNLNKYALEAVLTCSRGEEYASTEKFDLIILDAPCTNSGVLNKRPEARWRITEEYLNELSTLQRKIAVHALTLLSERGELWYMTCSILRQENEEIVEWLCKEHNLRMRSEIKIIPSSEGRDGGYACALTNL